MNFGVMIPVVMSLDSTVFVPKDVRVENALSSVMKEPPVVVLTVMYTLMTLATKEVRSSKSAPLNDLVENRTGAQVVNVFPVDNALL